MKRVLCLILSAVFLLGLGACGSKPAETNTWQEQYDLGIRYLSEGNYKEAIIAFTAAIQIDPKRAAVYEKLAEAYTLGGDTENAARILSDGLAATGSETLKALLEQLQASLLPQPTPEPENTGSPAEAPELPAVLLRVRVLEDGSTEEGHGLLLYDENDYLPFRQEWAEAMEPLITAGVSGDAETIQAEMQKISQDWALETFAEVKGSYPGINIYDQECYMIFWTVWDGAIIGVDFRFANGKAPSLAMEYRAAGGKGFSASYGEDSGIYYVSGDMKSWLYDGAFEIYQQQWDVNPQTSRATGYASAERRHGEQVCETWEAEIGRTEIISYVMEEGRYTNAFTDPGTGKACYIKRERIWSDGERRIDYWEADQELMERLHYVCGGV